MARNDFFSNSKYTKSYDIYFYNIFLIHYSFKYFRGIAVETLYDLYPF